MCHAEILEFSGFSIETVICCYQTPVSLYSKPITFSLLYAFKIVLWFIIWPKHDVSFCCFSDLSVK